MPSQIRRYRTANAPRHDGDVRMYRRLFVVCGRAGVGWRFIREHVIEDMGHVLELQTDQTDLT